MSYCGAVLLAITVSLLAVAVEAARPLTIVPALLSIAISAWLAIVSALSAGHAFQFAAQPLDLVDGRGFVGLSLTCIPVTGLCVCHGLLRLLEFLAELG